MKPRKPIQKKSSAAIFAEVARDYKQRISTPHLVIEAICLATILGSGLSIYFNLRSSKVLTTTIPAVNSLKSNVNCSDEAREELLARNPRLRLPADCALGK